MTRKERRPGIVRITLDLPRPLYDRLTAYVDDLRARFGATEQGVCRALLDDALTRAGHPPAGGSKRKRKP